VKTNDEKRKYYTALFISPKNLVAHNNLKRKGKKNNNINKMTIT